MARWIIPDIHGCFKTMRVLIEEQIRPSQSDELFFLGDYIDRGPSSRMVIEYIMALEEKKYNIRLLKGNHEAFCETVYDQDKEKTWLQKLAPKSQQWHNWMKQGGKETLKSYGIKQVGQFPEEHIQWMSELEYYILLEDYILVHAGFNFVLDDIFKDTQSMLWTREFVVNPKKTDHKKIIHGHVPVSLETIRYNLEKGEYNSIDLDNGVYKRDTVGYGNLCALELNSMKLLLQPNCDI